MAVASGRTLAFERGTDDDGLPHAGRARRGHIRACVPSARKGECPVEWLIASRETSQRNKASPMVSQPPTTRLPMARLRFIDTGTASPTRSEPEFGTPQSYLRCYQAAICLTVVFTYSLTHPQNRAQVNASVNKGYASNSYMYGNELFTQTVVYSLFATEETWTHTKKYSGELISRAAHTVEGVQKLSEGQRTTTPTCKRDGIHMASQSLGRHSPHFLFQFFQTHISATRAIDVGDLIGIARAHHISVGRDDAAEVKRNQQSLCSVSRDHGPRQKSKIPQRGLRVEGRQVRAPGRGGGHAVLRQTPLQSWKSHQNARESREAHTDPSALNQGPTLPFGNFHIPQVSPLQ